MSGVVEVRAASQAWFRNCQSCGREQQHRRAFRELFEACRNGDISRVKSLVNSVNVNAKDMAGTHDRERCAHSAAETSSDAGVCARIGVEQRKNGTQYVEALYRTVKEKESSQKAVGARSP
ncbi:Tankyrase-1 [Liparis tanakae]|uniref:Tankyrase-1 n=1 Tax=Liparis tanakae TaxID=230148 RepID=A0A4Z2H0B7_9TELE|nr:Tankyrase-1 [Liparis tanakae]